MSFPDHQKAHIFLSQIINVTSHLNQTPRFITGILKAQLETLCCLIHNTANTWPVFVFIFREKTHFTAISTDDMKGTEMNSNNGCLWCVFVCAVTLLCMCVWVCVCVFVLEFTKQQTASGMPVGGGVSSPDTGCLYYSVYYWQSVTQLSFDLWIGMVCIHVYALNEWLLSANAKLCLSVCNPVF